MGRGPHSHWFRHGDALWMAVANGPEQPNRRNFVRENFATTVKIWGSPDTPIISTDESNVCRWVSEASPGADRLW
ncbi:hypothetical protein Pan14r_11760 [Crateriforma conspicua]|uniref:Uncharacterized protein n=1 Tax=Crateriforma conspicua TaxID=2527996 RepID=A0A5C5Y2K2_9PLAN|nr:hypothetical protein Mal65_27580 [Crateriforma conspicua]TWT68893.1 hypothetical protein Pan14r_11760 [Crateriforma conspicua]